MKQSLLWLRMLFLAFLACCFSAVSAKAYHASIGNSFAAMVLPTSFAQLSQDGDVDYHELLQAVVDSIYDVDYKYVAGTTPGCVPQEAYDSYMETFASVLDINDRKDLSQDDYAKAIADLRQACEKINASIIMMTDGWYFIQSNYSEFYNSTGTYRNMYSGTDGMIYWKTADERDPYQYFIVKKLADGNYTIQNAYDKKYFNAGPGDAFTTPNIRLFSSVKPVAEQVLTPRDGGFYISNTENALPYHPLGHDDGTGVEGNIAPASVYTIHSTWKFVAADSTKFVALQDSTRKQENAAALLDELGAAIIKSFDMKAPAATSGLITAASQLSSNCEWTPAYGPQCLIDGDHNTHFHSDPNGMNLFTTDEYLQVDLNRDDVTSFTIEYWGRNDGAATGTEWHDNPTKFIIKATNTPENENSWTEVTTISNGFPANMQNAHYVSLPVNSSTAYRYYRFYVKATSSNNAYWNLSEFQLYEEVTPAATSTYSTVASAKALVDALDADIAAAAGHISNLTVDGTEMAPINEKFAQLDKILEEQEKIMSVVAEGKALNKSLFVWKEDGYIKEVNAMDDGTNQLWANATWTSITPDNDNYSYNEAFINDGYNLLGTLIDKDDQTYWHSDPNSCDLRTQENYLQIDLKQSDVKSFRIRVDRRNDLYQGANRHGVTPTKAILYGTNDGTVGTDVGGSCSNWTEITTLTDFPSDKNDASLWPYISQEITPATPYRYLRFRVTADSDNQPYWTISGFQILEAGDAAYDQIASQYIRVDGMKEASDKLTAAIDALQAKLDDGTAVISDTAEVKAAMAAVSALYMDTTQISELVGKAQTLVNNTEEGSYIGAVSDASLLMNLQTAVDDARASMLSASAASLKEKEQALADAYEAALEGVNMMEPGKWYYIMSATSDEDMSGENVYPSRSVKGAALYTLNNAPKNYGRFANGSQLRWGLDDQKGVDMAGDAEAMWHFIPAPDSLGKRVYYIQNLRSGLYIGDINTADNDYYVRGRFSAYPYRVDYVGNGEFNIVPLMGGRAGKAISFGDNARQVRADDIAAFTLNNRACFTFEEVDPDMGQLTIKFNGNTMRAYTLPFAVSGLDNNGDKVRAYGVHSIIDDSHVGLIQKNEFAAGEPMLLFLGDSTGGSTGPVDVIVNMPTTDLVTTPDTVNGLISSFASLKLKKLGYGYVSKNQLVATKIGTSITTYCAYLDYSLVTNMEGDPDVVLTVFGGILSRVDKVQTKTDANATVNVYTIDGALVKRNVKAAKATAGLKRGIYIVGKRKVMVR